MDMITQSIAAFLQPHTSSLSMPLVARAMSCLMAGGFSGEDFDSYIPALLGIAKLAKVQSQGSSTSLSPSGAPEPAPEPTDTNIEASYQICQRSFSSNSGSGYTIWYFGKSNSSILMPPTIPQAKTGHLYVHLDTSRNVFLYWMLNIANQWERVSSGVESPLNRDRVLAIRVNGEPSWITRASTVTTKTRKEKDI
ncbi:hypothetical protein EDB85DRAFT_2153122 [Lactarius pseudohatsudake]|nr:hypothetical protein EDB85DRAFT_2153122 [Lactarius pseudohatsudake]